MISRERLHSGFKSSGVIVALFLLLSACASSPDARVQRICPTCQPIELNLDASQPLVAYFRPSVNNNAKVLHIYLEGDGLPWRFNRPSTNPTSREMTALHLMQLDTAPSLYINRPCYGFHKPPPGCRADDWTFGRYSENIVSQMNTAIDQLKPTDEWQLVILGYSGGGTLAMLLAAHRNDVRGVITVAANLDHQSWSDHHGYLPLHNSLNAAHQRVLPDEVFRWHLAGGKDNQVPARLIHAVVNKDPYARFLLYADFDHACCWQDIWKALLNSISQERASTGTK